MKFTWISIIGILLILTTGAITKSPSNNEDELIKDSIKEISDKFHDISDELEENSEQGQLPILPPIILLDFTNGTNSSFSDEKSKRTINSNLGYGFQGNNLFSGKYNYYFPAGKTGTTVSIEESISPFLPRTLVENVKPITEKPETKPQSDSNRQLRFYSGDFQGQQQITASSYRPVFGERTKLQKSTAGNFDVYQKYSTTTKSSVTPYTTPRPGFSTSTASSSHNGYFTPKPVYRESSFSGGYTTSKPFNDKHTTVRTPLYVSSTSSPFTVDSNVNKHILQKSSPPKPTYSGGEYYQQPTSLNDYPKYTIENGVQYEHKIVWKYPDGKISEEPPTSYINSYAEYNSASKNPNYSSHDESSADQNEVPNYTNHQVNDYSSQSSSNLYYQGPMQFPKDQEINHQKPQTQFVTSMSFNGQKSSSENSKSFKEYYQHYNNHRPVSKYAVESPNAEYTYSVGNTPRNQVAPDSSSFLTSTGQLSAAVLSKYTPQAQKYLNKVFSSPKENYDNVNSESYTNTYYSNLLNSNPSISQYIKNPASILNAQPTFIQAGNSLIPVIILKVDGAPPIQTRRAPNINLKALLQQYITQYASSMSDFMRESNYDFAKEDVRKQQFQSEHRNPLFELKQLTDSLKEFSQQSQNPVSYTQKFLQSLPQNKQQQSTLKDSYGNFLHPDVLKPIIQTSSNEENRYYKKPQKVKSVQIIDDPRYTSYKVNS